MSLRRFGAFLRPFSAASWCDWKSQSPPARKCPFIPRGHLSMCPERAASLFALISSRRFRPDAYFFSFFFLLLCIDDHGSLVICRANSVRPKHLFDQNFDHDYYCELPFQGAGCPIMWG